MPSGEKTIVYVCPHCGQVRVHKLPAISVPNVICYCEYPRAGYVMREADMKQWENDNAT